jgi:hypothetical protein
MKGSQTVQSMQFVTVKGKRLAVLDAADWEAFVEWLETVEDGAIARSALAELQAAGNDPVQAGWLKWEEGDRLLEQLE